ncbi:MAG: hypothetical protein ABI232_08350 [Jatrophihabitantaceae bacterium]
MSAPAQQRPLWLLDIDGVVNALATTALSAPWSIGQWIQRTVFAPIDGRGLVTLPVLAARPVLDFITSVHESGAAEIRWHTTWRGAAITHLAPVLGLPQFPMSIAPEWQTRTDSFSWKIPAARRAVAAGRRLLWTEDALAGHGLPDATAAGLDDALLISPQSEIGLTPSNLASIAGWLSPV